MSPSKNQAGAIPAELRAVIHLFESDEELKLKARPFVDVGTRSVYWSDIHENNFGSGHMAVINWAHAIWTRSASDDLFWDVYSMEDTLKARVLNALAIAWGLKVA